MRVVLLITMGLLVCIGLYVTFIMPSPSNSDLYPEQGNIVHLMKLSYTKTDSITISFTAVNTSADTIYLQISEWDVYGVYSKFRRIAYHRPRPGVNLITFGAIFPKYMKSNISLEYAENHIGPFYNIYKYTQLAPGAEQEFQLTLGSNITSHMNFVFNEFRFGIQMNYCLNDEWDRLERITELNIGKLSYPRSSEPIHITIPNLGHATTVNKSEFMMVDYEIVLQLEPGVTGTLVVK